MSLDDRKQKHVSFDSSSILRSQTVGNMTETEVQKQMNSSKAAQPSTPSKSSERLLDGRKTPDYAMYSELFTPELARQIVLGKSISLFIIRYLFLCNAHFFPIYHLFCKSIKTLYLLFRAVKKIQHENTSYSN